MAVLQMRVVSRDKIKCQRNKTTEDKMEGTNKQKTDQK